MALKGVSLTVTYTAWNTSTNAPQTGDVSNHAIRVVKDGVSAAATNSPAELGATTDPGAYNLTLTTTEMSADFVRVDGKSSTANVVIIPISITTDHGVLPQVAAGGAGGLATADSNNAVKVQSGTGANQISLAAGLVALTTAEHTAIGTDAQTGLTAQGYTTARALKLDNADASVAAVKAQTDKLPATPAATGDAMALTPATHTAVATDVQTGLTTQGYTTARAPKLDNADAAVSGVAGSVWSNAARTLTAFGFPVTLAAPDSRVTRTGTAQAGGASTLTLDAGASAQDNLYRGQLCHLLSGTGTGQSRVAISYVGATKVLTLDYPWDIQPDTTSVFALAAMPGVKRDATLAVVASSVTGAVVASSVTTAVVASSVTGAVGSVTAPVTLTAGEHTAIQTDVTAGLTAQGYTTARAPKLDNLDASVLAVKTKTDLIPAGGPLAASAYVAPDNADIVTIKGVTDKLNLMIASDGAGDWLFDVLALSNAPSGAGGATDWTAPEKNQIRQALGLTGTTAATLTTGDVQTRLATSGYTAPDNTDIAAIKAKTDLIPAGGPLAASGYTAPDNTSIAAIKGKTDNLPLDPASNTHVDTRLPTTGYTAPDNTSIAAIKVQTDKLPALPAAQGDAMTLSGSTHTAITADVLDAAISGHLTAGSVGERISAAGSAGDPWSTILPGVYPSGSAGYLLSHGVKLDLTQTLDPTNVGGTLGGALLGAWADAFGKATYDPTGKTLALYAPGASTTVVTFDLTFDSSGNIILRMPR